MINNDGKQRPGSLTLVALPLGNLDDITTRALETLQSVDYILAEDTRELIKLAQLLEVRFPTIKSYRDQTHDRIVSEIVGDLQTGMQIALVSDRGTPTISDPGYKLVRDVRDAGIQVTTAPGATAAMAALSISGLPTDRFSFLGFLPRTAGKQQKIIKEFASLPATFIIYESPYRIHKLVQNIQSALGDEVELFLAKDITKLHEQTFSGTPSQILSQLGIKKLKGEWVVLGRNSDKIN